ncbi:MAG TPA: response regulator [Polyangiaceae bacterium]|jgi:two-component system chemotaxis sensor kinase CheA|nr:response regulator [Polyangiaceae bacterium]
MAADPYKYFRQEARDLVRDIGQGVLELEKGPTPELARRLLRLTHTLKGAARVVKQSAIAEHAHAIEEVLAPLREEGGGVAQDGVDGVLRLLDAIGRLVAELDVVKPVEPARQEEPAPVAKARVEEAIAAPRFDAAEIDVLLDAATEASVQLRGLRGGLSSLARMRSLAALLGAHDAERSDVPARPERRGARRPVVDEFRDEVSELERRFERGIELVEREIQQIQNAAERLRLIPVDAVFPALERTVRDAARALGKAVEFVGHASGLRIDAGMLGTLQSALIQIARNAVAHGIEPVAERTTRGKPAVGLVELDVRRRGSRLIFVCRDDGRGIDFDAVRKAAERRGVRFESAEASSDDVLRVLLRGGVSTASTVTEIAGRGVGFDVIREAQESVGGSIAVRTEPGRGTEVELVVAASLTSLDALLVEAGGVAAAIPLDAVRRTMRLAASDVSHGADGAFVVHEGNVVPFMSLARSLGSKATAFAAQDTTTAVVVHGEHALAVVGVDRLRGAANVVVRPLPALAVADRIVAGASLDGEGVPRLVLDPEGIVEATRRRLATSAAVPARALLPILVTDDSLTTRMLEQSILESAGYAVELATSAEEALELAANRPYALFLVDVEMPGMSGFDFVEKTRADPTLKSVPAILISSRSSPEDLRRGKEAGAAGYMIKGEFDQARLLDMIAALMRTP